MKRRMVWLLAAVMMLNVTACGQQDDQEEKNPTQQQEVEVELGEVEQEAIQEQAEIMAGLTVQAVYEEDAEELERDTFQEPPTDYDQGIVFRAAEPVTEFRFFAVEWGDETQGWAPLEGEVLYTQAELTPERELLITTSFPGDMPSRGISYVREGERLSYTISTSGLDGSLILAPME